MAEALHAPHYVARCKGSCDMRLFVASEEHTWSRRVLLATRQLPRGLGVGGQPASSDSCAVKSY